MLCAASLLVLLASPAELPPSFEEGKRMYFDLEYELAVFRFREATRGDALSDEERALAFAWLGLSYAQVAEMTSAREAFDEAVRHSAEVKLPKEAAPPPKAEQLLAEAKATAAAAPAEAPPLEVPAAPPPVAGASEGGGSPGVWLLAGGGAMALAGVLALGAGGGLGLLASATADEGNRAEFQADAARLRDEAQTSALAANVAYVASAALLVVAVPLLVTGLLLE